MNSLRQANAVLTEKLRRQIEVSKFREPLARAAYELQSRLFNILKQQLVHVYLVRGDKREKEYVVQNTVFVIAQYFSWTELVKREIQFVDLDEEHRTRKLQELQDRIGSLWSTDQYPRTLRIFAGEQRAIGETLIVTGSRLPECMGYGAFLNSFFKEVEFVESVVIPCVAPELGRGASCGSRNIERRRTVVA